MVDLLMTRARGGLEPRNIGFVHAPLHVTGAHTQLAQSAINYQLAILSILY
jgi:hypothetical protein